LSPFFIENVFFNSLLSENTDKVKILYDKRLLFVKPKSVVRACLYFGFLEEWILFAFNE